MGDLGGHFLKAGTFCLKEGDLFLVLEDAHLVLG